MRVLLDENPCDVTADSVGQAIAAASALAEKNGRMIVEVVVDGRLLSAHALDSEEQCAAPADEIRLTTADPVQLVCQTFEDAAAALGEVDVLHRRCADLLQRDQVAAAMQEFDQAITIWTSVQQALVMGLNLAGIELNEAAGIDGADDANESIDDIVQSLNRQLHLLREALERQDTVALADTLLYDLPPVISQWRGMLDGLRRRLSSQEI